ncbi:H-NS histone family protein [Burkholderia dolosa]|uniref:H-NS histone family protein n=1 Tax=Burkholderia dolosa TaxID=152500 RepID=UPI001B9F76AB|nr:H-NS histone family protein [Burkholderia dolosa]
MRFTEAARLAEAQAVVDDIRAKVAEYGVTEKDIFGGRRGKSAKQQKAAAEAKYCDPKTGATWSGRGRAPAWIKDAKNRNRFLIEE